MATINLLPWREELKTEKKRKFLTSLAITAAIGVATIGIYNVLLSGHINAQAQRNHFLEQEIHVLDGQIKEIEQIKETREKLVERMQVIQELQGNRPVVVRVFDELVKALPDGLFFSELHLESQQLRIKGKTESNNRVSNLMRNFDQSLWFTNPNLVGVEANKHSKSDNHDFELLVLQTTPEATQSRLLAKEQL